MFTYIIIPLNPFYILKVKGMTNSITTAKIALNLLINECYLNRKNLFIIF